MKPIINRNRKSSVFCKARNNQRRGTLNPDSNDKLNKFLINPEIYSMYKTNKTIHKYINQKLNYLKSIPKTIKNVNKEIKSTIHSRNASLNEIKSDKNKITKKNGRKNISITINKNKIKKGRNSKKDMLLIKKEYNSNKIYSSYKNLPNLNKKANIIRNYKGIIKSPFQTKGKLISNLYQNYSSSMSTGISNKNNNDYYRSCSHFLDNNSFSKLDINDSEKEIQDNNFSPIINHNINANHNLKINSNEDRNNNTTNNYEVDSSEDNMIDNKIFFKGGGDGSPITFGNSFSYTNSKRSSSTRRILKNNEGENNDNIDKNDDDCIFLLKSQNETLKKELKESNEQITFLKNEIEKLIKKKLKNNKNSLGVSKCPQPMPPVKKYSKNNSCIEQNQLVLERNIYHSHDDNVIKKNKRRIKNKK